MPDIIDFSHDSLLYDRLDKIAEELKRLADFFIATQKVVPEKESTKKKTFLEETIEYEGRTYSRWKPCKYKCGLWVAWADDYKQGDHALHMNPQTKKIMGFECPGR